MSSWFPWLDNFTMAVQTSPREMDPSTRAALMLGLIAILILGIGGMMVIWLFGRALRRRLQADSRRYPREGGASSSLSFAPQRRSSADSESSS